MYKVLILWDHSPPFENVYILLAVGYVFKWVEAIPTRTLRSGLW